MSAAAYLVVASPCDDQPLVLDDRVRCQCAVPTADGGTIRVYATTTPDAHPTAEAVVAELRASGRRADWHSSHAIAFALARSWSAAVLQVTWERLDAPAGELTF